jgi:hypothetical protein
MAFDLAALSPDDRVQELPREAAWRMDLERQPTLPVRVTWTGRILQSGAHQRASCSDASRGRRVAANQ